MSEAKLTYFNGWGLAEQARWMLSATGVSWSQKGLIKYEEFDTLRTTNQLLFNQLPLLEIDGLNLSQSQAIIRYLAERGNLIPSSTAEKAHVDMVSEAIRDCRGTVSGYPFSPNKENHLAEARKTLAKYFPIFEKIVNDKGGIYVNGNVSYADILLAELIEELCFNMFDNEQILCDYPKLQLLHSKVVAFTGIEENLSSEKRFKFPIEGKLCDEYCENVREVLGRNKK